MATGKYILESVGVGSEERKGIVGRNFGHVDRLEDLDLVLSLSTDGLSTVCGERTIIDVTWTLIRPIVDPK